MEAQEKPSSKVKLAIVLGTGALLFVGALLWLRAQSRINQHALASDPKPVTAIPATAGTYQPTRHYVATIEPWVSADVGPQLVAAYADTVLVRPGATVKRGEVLATLDCRESAATNQAVAMQARAIDTRQKALANQAARINSLVDGGFAPVNEAEQQLAASQSQLAELMATQAKLASASLAVSDCILKAPFDGEVSRRMADPGVFVRPGTAVVSIVDRSVVRVIADVPEGDFEHVGPGTAVRIDVLATDGKLVGSIARRSPAASASTRTVHFEIDVSDPDRKIPVGTTAELTINVGTPEPATIVPGIAAVVRGDTGTVYVIEGDVAKKRSVKVKGEALGTLYVDSKDLPPGTKIVTEGRSLLSDGDRITPKIEATPTDSHASVP